MKKKKLDGWKVKKKKTKKKKKNWVASQQQKLAILFKNLKIKTIYSKINKINKIDFSVGFLFKYILL